MTKEERLEYVSSLETILNRISSAKTNILETQGCLVDMEEYTANEEDMDRSFDAIDDALWTAKKELRKVIDNLNLEFSTTQN